MTEEERLRVQNSISISIALISFSGILIAGAVAAFITIGDKVTPGFWTWLFMSIVCLAILSFLSSIVFGGRGINATNNSIKNTSQTNPFPDKYDDGHFQWQVLCGIAGLLLGTIGFVGLSAKAMLDHKESVALNTTQSEIRALKSTIDKQSADISNTQSEIRTLKSTIDNHDARLELVKSQASEIVSKTQANASILTEILANEQRLSQSINEIREGRADNPGTSAGRPAQQQRRPARSGH
jgi:hypothetical protein